MEKLSYLKLMHDRVYAIENLCGVNNPAMGGRVPFKLFNKQKEIVNVINEHKRVLVYNGRQTGCSNVILANIVIEALFIPNQIIMIASHSTKYYAYKTVNVRDNILDAINILGEDENYIVSQTNKKITLKNGSVIIFVKSTADAFRGYYPNIIFFDNIMLDYKTFTNMVGFYSDSKIYATFNPHDDLFEYKDIEYLGFKVIESIWYTDDRYNTDLAWLTEDGTELYYEVKFTPESINLALSLGLKPTSTWYREMCKVFGHDQSKIRSELDCKFT